MISWRVYSKRDFRFISMLQKGHHVEFDKNVLFTCIDRLHISLHNEVNSEYFIDNTYNKSKIGLISQDGGYLGKIG